MIAAILPFRSVASSKRRMERALSEQDLCTLEAPDILASRLFQESPP